MRFGRARLRGRCTGPGCFHRRSRAQCWLGDTRRLPRRGRPGFRGNTGAQSGRGGAWTNLRRGCACRPEGLLGPARLASAWPAWCSHGRDSGGRSGRAQRGRGQAAAGSSTQQRGVDRRAGDRLGRSRRGHEVELPGHGRRNSGRGRDGRHRGAELRLGAGELIGRQRPGRGGHWLGLHHSRRRDHRCGATVEEALHDRPVVDRRAGDGLVDVLDRGRVHAADVVQVRVIGRVIRLTRPERHPADGPAGQCPGRKTHRGPGDGGTADVDETDQRGGVDRDRVGRHRVGIATRRDRDPAPPIVDLRPAAVVERREPPLRIVDPGPAPRGHIRPMAVAIRHPAGLHRRIPDRAVLRRFGPTPDRLEAFAPGHPLHDRWDRHAGSRRRTVLGQHRGEEGILRDRAHAALEAVRPGDRGRLMRADLQREVGAGHLRRPLHHGDQRRVVGIAGYHVVTPGRGNLHRAARGLHDIGVARAHRAEFEVGFSLRLGRGQGVVVERGDVQLRRGGQSEPVGLDLQVGAGAGLGPERIAIGERGVEDRLAPLVGIGGMGGDRAVQPSNPADACRGRGVGRDGRRGSPGRRHRRERQGRYSRQRR